MMRELAQTRAESALVAASVKSWWLTRAVVVVLEYVACRSSTAGRCAGSNREEPVQEARCAAVPELPGCAGAVERRGIGRVERRACATAPDKVRIDLEPTPKRHHVRKALLNIPGSLRERLVTSVYEQGHRRNCTKRRDRVRGAGRGPRLCAVFDCLSVTQTSTGTPRCAALATGPQCCATPRQRTTNSIVRETQ